MSPITFYLEDDNNEEVDFNGETLTFTLQMIKIYYNMFKHNYLYTNRTLKNSNQIVIALVANTDLVQKKSLVKEQLIKKLVNRLNYWLENV